MSVIRRVEGALYRAIELTRDTEDATLAVKKTADELSLSPNEVRLTCQAYNKSKAFHLGCRCVNKGVSRFDIADPDRILGVEKAAGDIETANDTALQSLPPADRLIISDSAFICKVASAFEGVPDRSKMSDHDREVLAIRGRRAVEHNTHLRGALRKALDVTGRQHSMQMREQLFKAAAEFERYSKDDKIKVSRRILNGFGDGTGSAALRVIGRHLGVSMPKVIKTASHSVFPMDPIYLHLSEAQACAASVRSVLALKDQLFKTAGPTEDLASTLTYRGLGGESGPGAAIDELLRSSLGGRGKVKELETLLPADVMTKIRGLQARNVFMETIIADPHLQSFSLPALQEAFNYAMETNPELLESPRKLANMMLHNINTSGVDDLYSMQAKGSMATDAGKRAKEKGELDKIRKEGEKTDAADREERSKKNRIAGIDKGEGAGDLSGLVGSLARRLGDAVSGKVSDSISEKSKDDKERVKGIRDIISSEETKATEKEDKQREDAIKEMETEQRAAKEKADEANDRLYEGVSSDVRAAGTEPSEAGFDDKSWEYTLKPTLANLGFRFGSGAPRRMTKDELITLLSAHRAGQLKPAGMKLAGSITEAMKAMKDTGRVHDSVWEKKRDQISNRGIFDVPAASVEELIDKDAGKPPFNI